MHTHTNQHYFQNHYENFPVASILTPTHLRPAIRTIYAFARSADDFADEGNHDAATRLALLNDYERRLEEIEQHRLLPIGQSTLSNDEEKYKTQLFTNIEKIIQEYGIPLSLFYDLLNAFKQDVVKNRYQHREELLTYCTQSANPVGAMMLHLCAAHTEENRQLSDKVCTSLQLINFWQDVAIDVQKNRVYLPQNQAEHEGFVIDSLLSPTMSRSQFEAFQACMKTEIDFARQMMLEGKEIAKRIPGRMGWELRLVIQGGLRIVEKIEAVKYDVFHDRPQLRKIDYLRLLWRAWKM